uniref:CUB domain-containing protein n=1 Tax=Panagrellus redivivus TaxID=6233 RepID=A0A7E4W0P7_PANRE
MPLPVNKINHHIPSLTTEHCHMVSNKNKAYYRFAQFLLFLCLILIQMTPCTGSHLRRHRRTNDEKPDFVCNVGDSHECVCRRHSGNLDGKSTECTQFLGVPQLQAIKMTLRKVNLTARVHQTNETFQQYIRGRVAYLLSQYCEHQANECFGSVMHMSQENIVILKVTFLPGDRLDLVFVVTKDTNVDILSESVVMDPVKIKYILGAQLGPLSRVLGGVHIDSLQLDTVKRKKPIDNSNRKLITLIGVIAGSFFICYIIAVIKCCRETQAKRRMKRNLVRDEKYGPSYGTCKEKERLLSNDNNNTAVKSGGNEPNAYFNAVNPEVRIEMDTPERPQIDSRAFLRMFACDPSSMPMEASIDFGVETDEPYYHTSSLGGTNSQPTKDEDVMPSVILVSSDTPPIEHEHNNNVESEPVIPIIAMNSPEPPAKIEPKNSIIPNFVPSAAATLLDTSTGFNPFDRPLSRRGSRTSTPEEGEECADDDREDTPQPLGDGDATLKAASESLQQAQTHLDPNKETWSSDSEPDNEVYQRLSESELNKDDDDDDEIEEPETPWKKRNNSSDVDSEVELDTKDDEEEEMLNRHQYEHIH